MKKKPPLDKKLMESLKRIPSTARTAKGNKLVKEAVQEDIPPSFQRFCHAIRQFDMIDAPYTSTVPTTLMWGEL